MGIPGANIFVGPLTRNFGRLYIRSVVFLKNFVSALQPTSYDCFRERACELCRSLPRWTSLSATAPEDWRSPKAVANSDSLGAARSVLECASPLALFGRYCGAKHMGQ